nr:hypothetical protein Iba_chr15bCG2580 [Ipomoea batatas]
MKILACSPRINALRIHFSVKLGQRKATRKRSPLGTHNLKFRNSIHAFNVASIGSGSKNNSNHDIFIPSVDIAGNHLQITAAVDGNPGAHIGGHGISHVAQDCERSGTVLLQLSQDCSHAIVETTSYAHYLPRSRDQFRKWPPDVRSSDGRDPGGEGHFGHSCKIR